MSCQLHLTLLELSNAPGESSVLFKIQDLIQSLPVGTTATLQFLQLSKSEAFEILAQSEGSTIGSHSSQLQSLVNLDSDEPKEVSLTLNAQHGLTVRLNCQFIQADTQSANRCPYLDHLASASPPSHEQLLELWDKRNLERPGIPNSYIRMTMEAEVVGKVEPELQFARLSDLTLSELQNTSAVALKSTIKTLTDDVNAVSEKAGQLPLFEGQLKTAVDERRDTQAKCAEENRGLEKEWREKSQQLEDLIKLKADESASLIEQKQLTRSLETEIDYLQDQISLHQRMSVSSQSEASKLEGLQISIDCLSKAVTDAKSQKENLQKKANELSSQMQKIREKADHKRTQIVQETEEIQSKLQEVLNKKSVMADENNQLKAQIEELKARISRDKSLKSQIEQTAVATETESARRQQAQEDLRGLAADVEGQMKDCKQKQKKLIDQKRTSAQTLSSLEEEIERREHEILEYRKKLYLTANRQITLEQVCCVKADLSQLEDDLSKIHKLHAQGRESLIRTINTGSDFLVEETGKIVQQVNDIDVIIDAIDDKENEIDNLNSVMAEVKKRQPPYVPVTEDPIDIALSEYLNNREQPILVPFTRRDEGVYMFGTQKILLKLEGGNIRVRVGGGYSSIEEFLQVYTPIELEDQEIDLKETYPRGAPSSKLKSMSPHRASCIIKGTVDAIEHGSPPRPRKAHHKPAKK